jgi:SAM-dependent methyltransferase
MMKKIVKQILLKTPVIRGYIREFDRFRLLAAEAEAYKLCGKSSKQDDPFLKNHPDRTPKIAKHAHIWNWIEKNFNRSEVRVLEVGSRSVISNALWKAHIPNVDYTGFDYMDGPNVNVVGDAHHLSKLVGFDKYDLLVSFAVFEHLMCPWLVVEEISKVLKVGGVAVIETHFSYSEHEMPWHFFQFNSVALEILFNEKLGFEVIDSGMSSPMIGRFAKGSEDYLLDQPIGGLFCHSSIIVKKVKPMEGGFCWGDLVKAEVLKSSYPIDKR